MNQDFHTRLRLLACSFNNSIEVAQDQILLRTCLLRTRRFCSGPNIAQDLFAQDQTILLRTKYCSGLVCSGPDDFAQDQIFAQDLCSGPNICSGLVLRTKYLLRTCAQDLCSGPNICSGLVLRTKYLLRTCAQDQILLRTYLLRTKYCSGLICSGPNICSGLVLRTKTTFAQDNSFKCKIYSFELINKLSMTNMGSSIVFSYFLLRLTKKTAIERIFAFFSYKFPFFFLYFFNSGSVAKFATNYKLTISAL